MTTVMLSEIIHMDFTFYKVTFTTLTVAVRIFNRVGLQTKLVKTKLMVCNPGLIWGKQGDTEYKRRVTGEGSTFLY